MLNAVRALMSADAVHDAKIGQLVSLSEEARGAAGTRYFVDNNFGTDSGDGASWDAPWKTLSYAMAVSHANIALKSSTWAKRNSIYLVADDNVEDLVAFAQKTDVVGMGSSDPYPMACIRGNHTPVNASMGARFFNIRFRPTASADLVLLATAAANCSFHGCIFDAHYGAFTAPSAIDITDVPYCSFIGNDFYGAFSASVIDIGAGAVNSMRIIGNVMLGGAVAGILVTGTTTIVQGRMALIHGNVIYTVGCTINDGDDDTFIITDNHLISDAATGTASVNVDARLSTGNMIVDATKNGPWPRLDDT
jgi:hypothetical protein